VNGGIVSCSIISVSSIGSATTLSVVPIFVSLVLLHNTSAKPIRERFTAQFTRRYLKNNLLLLIYRGVYLKSIQKEEGFHRCVTGAFIAIHKWMVLDE